MGSITAIVVYSLEPTGEPTHDVTKTAHAAVKTAVAASTALSISRIGHRPHTSPRANVRGDGVGKSPKKTGVSGLVSIASVDLTDLPMGAGWDIPSSQRPAGCRPWWASWRRSAST